MSTNNPGNIRGENGEFKNFDTPEGGYYAMFKDLSVKLSGNSKAMKSKLGENYTPTISNLLNVYAPSSENNTNNYISFVAKESGLNPNAPLTAADAHKIIIPMIRMEKGNKTAEPYKQIHARLGMEAADAGDYENAASLSGGTDSKSLNTYSARNKAKADRVKSGQTINKSEDEDDNYSLISDMMEENPVIGLFLLIMGMMTGLLKGEDATEIMTSFGNKSPEKRAEAEKELDKNPILKALYNKSKVDVAKGANLPTGEDIKKFNWSLLHELKGKESTIYPVRNADGSDKGGDKVITSSFGERDLDNPHASKIHPAFDFRGKSGDQVLSMFSGTVVAIGGSEHAKTVVVKNDNGTISTYMHVEAAIKNGETVNAGEKIATISQGSEKYPAHLDVRTQDAKSGIYIHPQFYMDIKGMGADYKAGAITDKETVLINKKTGQTFDMAYAVQHMNDVDASVDNQVTNTDFPPKVQQLAAAAAPVHHPVVHSSASDGDKKTGKSTIEQTASIMKNNGVVASANSSDMMSSLFPALSIAGKTKSISAIG